MPILNPSSVQVITSDLERRRQDISADLLPAGETALLTLQAGISAFFKLECANLMRLRLYSSEAARTRDLPRPIATRPRAGRGLLLEVVSTATLQDFELSPVVWNANAGGVYMAVTNLESVPASPVFSIEYWEF